MTELGAPMALVCSSVHPEAIDDLDLTASQLHRIGQVAAEHGVSLAFEALAWGRHINRSGRPGRPSSGPIIRRSRWRWTLFTCWPEVTTVRPWTRCRVIGSASCKWPTPRCWT